jgi:hypothetical protein
MAPRDGRVLERIDLDRIDLVLGTASGSTGGESRISMMKVVAVVTRRMVAQATNPAQTLVDLRAASSIATYTASAKI